jgi:glycerophosphoryl diester phosphodiesterase
LLDSSSLYYYLLVIIFFLSNHIIGSENEEKSYFDCPCPHIIAHQGSSLELPPNTIDAFQLALDQGADIIELDIWRSRDGVWVVIHDRNLSRITGVDKDIMDLTYEEIQSLDAGYNFTNSSGNYSYRNKNYRIPSLEQVFKMFNNEKINIEIKGDNTLGLSDLVDLVMKYQMERKLLVVSSSYRVIKKFRKITNYEIATAASKPDIMKMIYLGKIPGFRFHFDAFQLPFYSEKVKNLGFLNKDWINSMQSKGLEVHYWTIDNVEDIKNAVTIGVNGIITNKPKTAYDVLVQLGKR